MNRQTIYDEDDVRLNDIYSSAYKDLHAPQEVYRKVMNMDQKKEQATKTIRRLPKVASIVIVLICVMALGGVGVWAMTSSPLKDYFFDNSDKEFAEIYNAEGKEYFFGSYKLLYEGSVFDNATGDGLLHFSVWDKDGKPVDIKDAQSRITKRTGAFEGLNADQLIMRFIIPDTLADIDGDRCYILLMYMDTCIKDYEDNNVFMRIHRHNNTGRDYFSEKNLRFVILNEDDLSKLKTDIESLDTKKITDSLTESDILKMLSSSGTMQPEIVEILGKYNVLTAENDNSEPQVILVAGLKITVGRMKMKLEYEEDCKVDKFAIIKEDGTKTTISRQTQFNRDGEVYYHWGPENQNDEVLYIQGSSSSSIIDYDPKIDYNIVKPRWSYTNFINFKFILGTEEKVKIEINGEIYE